MHCSFHSNCNTQESLMTSEQVEVCGTHLFSCRRSQQTHCPPCPHISKWVRVSAVNAAETRWPQASSFGYSRTTSVHPVRSLGLSHSTADGSYRYRRPTYSTVISVHASGYIGKGFLRSEALIHPDSPTGTLTLYLSSRIQSTHSHCMSL
jgi:hypothetical protein